MSDKKDAIVNCAQCSGKFCFPIIMAGDPLPTLEESPKHCVHRQFGEVLESARDEYKDVAIREFARQASIQEAECYQKTSNGLKMENSRIEEIIKFSRKCNYTTLGLAFCVGLREEARAVADIFEANELAVKSVCCKVGRVPKEDIGLEGSEKILGAELFEPMCNPIAQAKIMNSANVDFVILLGLCVGHDTLFIKYCTKPITVLAVKDRLMAHNPLGAVYLLKSPYYNRLSRKL